MITEKDLEEAIAECEGERNPNANTCIKLASFYTIRNEMYGRASEVLPNYSRAPAPARESMSEYNSDTEFGQIIASYDLFHVLSVVDELMTTLQVVNPRLYQSVLRKLSE